MDGWMMSDRGPSLLFVFFFVRSGNGQRRTERSIEPTEESGGGGKVGQGGNSGEGGGRFNEIDADGRE